MDFSDLRFTVTRLCGGQDLVLTPHRKIPVDCDRVFDLMKSPYTRGARDSARFDWNGIMVTIYPAGSIMFSFFNDRVTAERYARMILSEVCDENDERTVGFVEERI
ncbi:MAG: hypothetical protein J5673_04190 [Candidatus Methanomethylophilaceae archaeon]|nr:hypothetical protein [Candidatus Methanomethylophilaceae archaeon]